MLATFTKAQSELIRKKQVANAIAKVQAGKSLSKSEQSLVDSIEEKTDEYGGFVAGMDRLAQIISEHFKIICTRQYVHKWRSQNPPFPAPVNSNRYNLKSCLQWVEDNVMPKRGTGSESQTTLSQQAFEAKQRQTIREDEEHEFMFAVEKGKYIELAKAEREIVGMSKKIFAWVRSEIERNATADRRDKLAELGVAPETVAAFYAFDIQHAQATIDAVSAVAARHSKEAVDAIIS